MARWQTTGGLTKWFKENLVDKELEKGGGFNKCGRSKGVVASTLSVYLLLKLQE